MTRWIATLTWVFGLAAAAGSIYTGVWPGVMIGAIAMMCGAALYEIDLTDPDMVPRAAPATATAVTTVDTPGGKLYGDGVGTGIDPDNHQQAGGNTIDRQMDATERSTTTDNQTSESTDTKTHTHTTDWEHHVPATPRQQRGHCGCGERIYETVSGANCYNCGLGGGLDD